MSGGGQKIAWRARYCVGGAFYGVPPVAFALCSPDNVRMHIPHIRKVVWPPPPLPKEPQPVTIECHYCKTKQVLMVQMITVGWPVMTTGEAQTVECLECKQNFYPFLSGPIASGPFKA
jgi:hypothetical protein